ncbi:hypothetical protein [Flaviaesturariibacter terrae]
MRLPIHDNLSIADLQERFQKAFPNLTIEFYKKPHRARKGSALEDMLDKQKRIGEIRRSGEEGELEILSSTSVRELEQCFHDQYGLNVQVFRREPSCMVQTTATDRLTLAEQNALAASSGTTLFPTQREQSEEYDAL